MDVREAPGTPLSRSVLEHAAGLDGLLIPSAVSSRPLADA